MTPEEKEMYKLSIDNEKEDRKTFRTIFSSLEGQSFLVWLGNECGYYAMRPSYVNAAGAEVSINPDMIALFNRVLNKCGIVHPENLFQDMEARMGVANDDDLVLEARRLNEEEDQ